MVCPLCARSGGRHVAMLGVHGWVARAWGATSRIGCCGYCSSVHFAMSPQPPSHVSLGWHAHAQAPLKWQSELLLRLERTLQVGPGCKEGRACWHALACEGSTSNPRASAQRCHRGLTYRTAWGVCVRASVCACVCGPWERPSARAAPRFCNAVCCMPFEIGPILHPTICRAGWSSTACGATAGRAPRSNAAAQTWAWCCR